MQLFTVGKVPMYCEGITHRLERRKDREVKVVDLSLKVQPFSSQLAAALDAEYGFVKRTLFKIGNGEPVVDLRAVEFKLPAERQRLLCFAAPDIEKASIAFDQVKVTKIRARSSKDGTGWTLLVHVSFGPCDKSELAYVNDFYTGQRFITWEQAEPSLDFDDEQKGDKEDEDADEGGLFAEETAVDHDGAAETLSLKLLGKRCFLTVDEIKGLSDAEREELQTWATSRKKGPVLPMVVGTRCHVAGDLAEGVQACTSCGAALRGIGEDPMPYVTGSFVGLDCGGSEDARPTARRGAKKGRRPVDHEAERTSQKNDGAKRSRKKR